MISNTPSKARSPRGKKRDEAAQREPEGIQANEWDDKHDGRGRRKSTKSVVAFKWKRAGRMIEQRIRYDTGSTSPQD